MKVFIVNIILLFSLLNGDSSFFDTNYIGKQKDDIVKIITQNFSTLRLNTSDINNTYNYLKFEDKIQEITVLFFLSDNNICTLVRFMSDYSNINDVLEDINQNYSKIDNNNWNFTSNGKLYNVNLDEGDWFFTVSIKEMK